jgi:hypothetical protein
VEEVDARSDVYSLGVILHEMLTRTFPIDVVGTWQEVLDKICNGHPTPPSRSVRLPSHAPGGPPQSAGSTSALSPAIDSIVLKALSKERDRRYESAGALARDLRRFQKGLRTMAEEEEAELGSGIAAPVAYQPPPGADPPDKAPVAALPPGRPEVAEQTPRVREPPGNRRRRWVVAAAGTVAIVIAGAIVVTMTHPRLPAGQALGDSVRPVGPPPVLPAATSTTPAAPRRPLAFTPIKLGKRTWKAAEPLSALALVDHPAPIKGVIS